MIQVVEKDSLKVVHWQLVLFEYDLIILHLPCLLSFQGCSLTFWRVEGSHYQMRTGTVEMSLLAMVMFKQLQFWIQFSSLQECSIKTAFDRKVYTFSSLHKACGCCTSRAGKIRFSGTQKSVLWKASSLERAPCNFVFLNFVMLGGTCICIIRYLAMHWIK